MIGLVEDSGYERFSEFRCSTLIRQAAFEIFGTRTIYMGLFGKSDYERQLETSAKQLAMHEVQQHETQQQLDRSKQQFEMAERLWQQNALLIERGFQNQERFQKLLEKWEEQTARLDALLRKWESK